MKGLLAPLGSLAVTFPAMALLAAALVARYSLQAAPDALVTAPLAVLTVNLLAALATHPRLRRRFPLLAFHLCLLAALGLSLAGLLTGLEGRVEVLDGEAAPASAIRVVTRGPWHPEAALERLHFASRGFRVDYAPSLVRQETRATVAVPDDAGGLVELAIGDTRPLVWEGFRVYTTPNKGYAAVVTWVGHGAAPERGALHFPSYPSNDWNPVLDWRTPGGDAVRFDLGVPLAPVGEAWAFDSARVPRDLALTVRHAGGERRLAPGEWLAVGSGRLRYEYATTWMGYRIAYDPTLPWLLASGIVGALALAWHFFLALPAPAPARGQVGVARAAGA